VDENRHLASDPHHPRYTSHIRQKTRPAMRPPAAVSVSFGVCLVAFVGVVPFLVSSAGVENQRFPYHKGNLVDTSTPEDGSKVWTNCY
jgi:hypothetical protein